MPSVGADDRSFGPNDAVQRAIGAFSAGFAYGVVLLGRSFEVIWASSSLEPILGWTTDELAEITVPGLIHPADLADVMRLMVDAQRAPVPFGTDSAQRATNWVRLRRRDGSFAAVEFAANNCLDDPDVQGILIVLHDVSERQQLDDIHRAMVHGSADDVRAKVGALLSWQLGAEVELCVTTGVPRPGWWSVPVPDTQLVLDVRVDGARPPNEWWSILADRAAELIRLVARRELGDAELRRALGDRTALMSAVSHDLSNPIAAIRMLSTLLDEQGDHLTPAQRIEMIRRIERDAEHTSRVLGDLRAVDRMLRDPDGAPFTTLRVADLVADVVEVERRGADERTVTIAPIDADLEFVGDPALFSRALANLITNAMVHADAATTVQIGAARDGDVVEVWVCDDGPGVHPSVREGLFDPGVGRVRADGGRSGLGLFLVRSFVERLGGTIHLDDTWSPGARFVMRLPAPMGAAS
jgi:PAS domain S-box-containing protein